MKVVLLCLRGVARVQAATYLAIDKYRTVETEGPGAALTALHHELLAHHDVVVVTDSLELLRTIRSTPPCEETLTLFRGEDPEGSARRLANVTLPEEADLREVSAAIKRLFAGLPEPPPRSGGPTLRRT